MNTQAVLPIMVFITLTIISISLMRYVFSIYGFSTNPSFLVRLMLNPLMIIALASALGCRLVFYSMFKNLTMSEVFLSTQVTGVFILLAGYFLFHDVLTKKQIVGAILILLGVGLI